MDWVTDSGSGGMSPGGVGLGMVQPKESLDGGSHRNTFGPGGDKTFSDHSSSGGGGSSGGMLHVGSVRKRLSLLRLGSSKKSLGSKGNGVMGSLDEE